VRLRSRLERKLSMLLSSPAVAELERRAALEVLAVERLGVDLRAVDLRAVDLLAVDFFAVVFRAVLFRAVDFLDEPPFALVFLAAIYWSSWSGVLVRRLR
jgi:hypothetical protein